MRYEDTTGSISSSSTPEARSDADTLANGSNGPASGNVITGAGTTTGKAGADSPQSGHVVAVRGAGGTDSSDNGSSLHVDGRFGTLVMDEHGNYKYVADGHAPANFRDLFQYTLADTKGGRSVADLVISRGGEIKVADNAQKVIPGPDGVVTLPAGVDLNDVHVVGRDLVINMPDGSQIVIVDGAVFVPQLVLGGVEVPSTNLAALLIDAEPRPAAGTPQSSGGNFDVPVPPLDPGVPLGDLIPPTELVFTPPTFHEVNGIIDRQPTIEIQPDGQPASVAAIDSVNEKGLPTRNGGEPAGSGEIADGNGSNNSDTSEAHGGTIVIDSPDGVAGVSINNVLVTGVIGQQIPGAFGTLTITGFSGDNILYTYTLTDNTSGNSTHDDFSVTVTDDDGDQATATLVVNIIDDVPTARPDTDAVAAGTFGPETGNVLTGVGTTSGTAGADTVGADNAHISGVTGFNGSVDNDATGGFIVNGQYGVLTLQSDGSYSYTRNPGTPGGVNDVFNYTLTDGDGDTSTTTLTISIGDSTPQTGENPLIRFDDDALPGGNPGGVGDDSPDTVNAAGQLAGSGGDGPITFAVQTTGAPAGFSYVSGGAGIVLIQQNGHTVLTVTVQANGSYSVVQNAPIDHPAGGDENNQVFTINYTVTDQDNDSAPGTFTINVDDDTPTVSLVGEGEPQLTVDETDLSINASASFAGKFAVSFGADGPAAANSLSYTLGVNAGATGLVDVATGQPIVLVLNGGVVEGHVGDASGALAFTVSVDASGTVTLDQIRALQHADASNPDDSVTLANDNLVTLTATATDHDSDTASQTLNIGQNLHFEDDGPTISLSGSEPGLTVDETVLGTDASGSFAGAFTSAFGADGAGTVTYALSVLSNGANSGLVDTATNQPIVLVLNGGVVEGHVGNAAGLLAFTVSVDANGNVTLDQIRAVVHPDASNPDDSVTLSADNLVSLTATVTDKDGDSQSATLNIGQNLNFEDDGPSITLSGSEPSLTVDETNLAINAGPTNFAPAFAPVFGADGAAAVNALTYTLGITGGNGTNSGLIDTATDEAVILVNNGGVIEGRTANSNLLVFTVTVSSSGQVSLDQVRAVAHPDASNPDDSLTLSADNLITLTATATDGDGDQASATLNIGQNLNFEDDGPSANNDTDTTNPVTDTADGNVITGVGTTEGPANADAPGADGFGSITNLVGFNGSSDSDATGGFDVNGQFGTLHMDANGNYTYTRTGGPGGAIETFTYTYVDGDGDPATATLTITIADERPVAGTVNVGLDDDALAGGNLGGIGDDPDSVNATGNLPGSGGDAPLTFGVLLTGAPAGFSYVSGGAGIVLVQQNGVTVLTVTVNSTTGAYSVVQNAPILHSAGGDENNQLFTINYTVTDSDTDVANGTINISVDDDTPTVSANGTQPNLTVDETVLATNATADFSGVFTHSFGADGAAAANSVTYSLGINAGATGLTDVATGLAIVLVNNAGVIEGHVGNAAGAIAFTVTVDASGNVTLDQQRALTHPNAANPDDSVTLANDNLITLTQTVTDKDGDSASATANIGTNLNFEDDGPTVTANGAQPSLTVDETVLATNATADFSGIFSHSFGADGAAAANSVTYSLGINAGATGLVDTATNEAVVLVNNAGVIEGRTATTNLLVFTVSVDGSGNVTLDQIRAVVHPNTANPDDSVTLASDNLITLTQTVTDKDGDQASATANIGQNLNFEDDGPSATIVTTGDHVSLDESVGIQIDSNDTTSASVIALFSGVTAPVGTDTDLPQYATNANAIVASTGSSFGADGAGTTAFSLNVSSAGVDSGLNTTDGQDIFLFKEGNLIVGRTAGGTAAFAIAIDNTGHVSTVEYLSIQHSDATNPDDVASIANGAVLAVVTVTDKDGDSATNSVAIGSQIQFQDSGPVMTAADNINIQNSGDLLATGGFHYNLGADGAPTNNDVFKTVTFSAVVNGVTVQTTVPLTQVSEDANSAQFSFSFDYSNGGGTAHETGTITFDKTNGTYTVDLDNPLQGISVVQTATGTLFQGYQVGTSTPDNTQPDVSVTQISSSLFVQFTGIAEPGAGTGANNLHTAHYNLASGSDADPTAFANGDLFAQAGSWVSTSNSANGVAGDTIQGGEVLDFNLYSTNPTGNLGLTPTASADTMFLKFDGIGASEDLIIVLKLYDTSTGTYTTKALVVENSDIQKGPGTGSGLFSSITLDNNDGLIVIEPNDYQQGNTNLVIVGAQIAGSDEGITGSGINFNDAMGAGGASSGTQLLSTDVNDGPMKISSIGFITTTTTAQTADLTFNVTIQDGDGDSLTQTIHATITANADSTSAISLSPSVTTVAPVVLDLNGDGTQFLATDSGVHYNYGSGSVSTAWASPQDGILVNDANHDGNVSASEFVFGSDGQTDLQALSAQYGSTLDANDADFGNFAVWQDANSNGKVDAGELQSLTARGIASISLSSDGISYSAAGGDVQVAGTGSYTRTDGSTGLLADAAFVTESRSATNSVLMGALAAAGLAAESSATATTVATLAATTALTGIATQHTQAFAPVAVDAVAGTNAGELLANAGTAPAIVQAAALHASDAGASHGFSVAGSESHPSQAPTELLQSTAPVADAAAAGPATAASIIMPSAAQLAAADAGVGGAQHNQVIGQVLADALHGGGSGPDLDAVLSSLPSQGGAHNAALETLASQAGAAVPNGDSGAFAGFTAANAAFTMEHMVMHADAAPSHA